MVKGLRVVVKALMARKNKQPVKYCHWTGSIRSFLPTPKNRPPANRDKNIPWNSLALVRSGFLNVFRKFLCNRAPYTANLLVSCFLKAIYDFSLFWIAKLTSPDNFSS